VSLEGGRREASPIARTHDVICSGVEEDEEERQTGQRCRMGTGVIGRRRGFVEGSKETMLLRERRNCERTSVMVMGCGVVWRREWRVT
jgi:hypothetical protein